MNTLLIVTPTWARPGRLQLLARCAAVWAKERDLHWILVEDGPEPAPEVAEFLLASGVEHTYLATGPTRDKGHAQRNAALEFIADHGLRGVVYNADDDNRYDPRLPAELRTVRRVALLPVGNLGPNGVERPLVTEGRVTGWDAGWLERRYPVDMAGFAFHSSLLAKLNRPFWQHAGVGGESEFLSRLVRGEQEFELLCSQCSECLVWHND